MRHAKHSNQLGRKKEHRTALMANMAMALIKNRRIRTTLPKAKALRPFIEKVITLAKKAHATEDKLKKQHYHTQALSRVRDLGSVNRLFDVLVEEFVNRPGGYTRIYKLVPRRGDAADMALIELVAAGDEGYGKRKSKAKKAPKADAPVAEAEESAQEADAEAPEASAESAEEASAEEPSAEVDEASAEKATEESGTDAEKVAEDSADSGDAPQDDESTDK